MAKKPQAEVDAEKRILGTQFNFGFNVNKYLDQAIRSGVGDVSSYALALILKSPEFKTRFPGITKPDGTLRISPSDYIAREEQFASIASQYGFGLTRAQVGGLVSQGVDPDEFKVRAVGLQQANNNPQLVQFLNQQIDAVNATLKAGQPKVPKINNATDAVNFFTGRADSTVYSVYEAAELQAAAQGAGVSLSGFDARQIARGTVGVLTPDQAQSSFGTIAERMRKAGPELAGFLGADWQSKLRTIEFGGTDRVKLALEAEQALKQAEAALKAGAGPQLKLAGGRPTTGQVAEAGF